MAGKGGKRSTSFKKGQSGNPGGKPVNARNRVTDALLTELADDFKENGKAAVVEMRTKDPSSYVRVIASLLPKDVNFKHTIIEELEGLSDDDLRERIEQLERTAAAGATVSSEASIH